MTDKPQVIISQIDILRASNNLQRNNPSTENYVDIQRIICDIMTMMAGKVILSMITKQGFYGDITVHIQNGKFTHVSVDHEAIK